VGVAAAAVLTVLLAAAPGGAQVAGVPDLPAVPDVELPEVPVSPPVEVPDAPLPLPTGGDAGPDSSTSGGSTAPRARSSSTPTSGRTTSAPRNRHTRFDRLPPRYERLLERIARGRDVDRNLARLERALASASPRLRARILRLVRREIAALGQGRVTAQDRRVIRRLRRVEDLLAPGPAKADPGAQAAAAPLRGPADIDRGSAPGQAAAGTGAAASGGATSFRREPAEEPNAGRVLPAVPLPGKIVIGGLLLILVLILLSFAATAFLLAATPGGAVPSERARRFVTGSRSDLAFTGLVALTATMLVVLVGVLF
jgi:hypothetical protein